MNDPNEYSGRSTLDVSRDQLERVVATVKRDPVWMFTLWNPPITGPCIFIPRSRIVAWEPEYVAHRTPQVGAVIHAIGGEKISVCQNCELISTLWEKAEC